MIQRNIKCVFFVLWVLFWIFNIAVNTGAEENTEIFPIKSVPDIVGPDPISREDLEFSGKGTIQRIGKDEVGEKLIVIDDRLMYFGLGIKYYNNNNNNNNNNNTTTTTTTTTTNNGGGESVSFSKFYKGKRVGYRFNEKRKIIELHLISD